VGAEAAGDLPLGLWHNFGGTAPLERSREIVRRAFELGITHFALALQKSHGAEDERETAGTCAGSSSEQTTNRGAVTEQSGRNRRQRLANARPQETHGFAINLESEGSERTRVTLESHYTPRNPMYGLLNALMLRRQFRRD